MAAEREDADSQYVLAYYYHEGVGVRRDRRKAIHWLRRSVAGGSTSAIVQLGRCLARRRSSAANYHEANQLFRRAARLGSAGGMIGLGMAYWHGRGVRESNRRALRWFLAAAEKGEPYAVRLMGAFADSDWFSMPRRDAAHWELRAAQLGDAVAQNSIGLRYSEGKGVRRDLREAERWYRKAARHGHPHALYNLGQMYRRGVGVAKSWSRALAWYRRAASKGHPGAYHWLVDYYEGRCGTPPDTRVARSWLRRAEQQASRDQVGVCVFLGEYYGGDDGLERDVRKGIRWLRRGAREDDAECIRILGTHYHDGDGVARDYRRANELGDERAPYLLGRCYSDGDGVRRDRRQARKWMRLAMRRGELEARRELARMQR